ncbi:MAG: Tat pathway signal protein [Actinomyces sp.]|uniref:ABC transporter permease n=1 Tax=Actinomyces sp. TaxID=29317 RepID=UPI0026DC203D|nr:Tat pathway signal protein [Actinomyces sp.]MDO4243707.1 Tat pathway signal protein [Actinomyces sp.]
MSTDVSTAPTLAAAAAPRPGRRVTPMAWSPDLAGLLPAVRLTVRRVWLGVAAWLVPLWGLAAAASSYEAAYPSLASRETLIEAMRASAGTRLLYGVLPLPGTLGQLTQWEIGTYLLVCTGLMSVLLTCRLLRADEDSGRSEVLRGAGVGRAVPLLAPLIVVGAAVALLATGIGATLAALHTSFPELTVAGAWALAGTVAVTGWAMTGLAALVCQLARSGPGARGLALSALGASFAVRVLADETGAARLRWLSPLAWRDIVEPYTSNRVGPLVACAVAGLLLNGLAAVAYARREYQSGYLPDRSASPRRWRVGGHAGLLARLMAGSAAGWAVAVTAVSALFGAMSGAITDLLEPGSATAAYVVKMASGSPVRQFMSLLTILTVLVVVVAAVQRATALAAAESDGFVEAEAATGVGRTRLFVAQAGAALGQGAALLVLSGAVMAWSTSTQVTADHAVGRAFVMTVSQLPGLMAAVGIALALVGLAPRWVALVWGVVAWSAFAQFLGGLVKLPTWAADLSVLGHGLDVVGPMDWGPLAVQTGVGALGLLTGLVAYRRRDLGA